MISLQVPEALIPFLSTGKSESIPKLFNRFLSTFLHVRAWYEHDHFEDPAAVRSIKHVRSLHMIVAEKLNKKSEVEGEDTDDQKVWMSQFDMVSTQCALIGLLLWDPERCGISLKDNYQDLLAIMYMWRCLGYFMGIKDEYNLFADSDDYESAKELCGIFLRKFFLPSQCPYTVFESHPLTNHIGYRMALDAVLALAPMLPAPISGNVIIHYWTICFVDEIGNHSVAPIESFTDYMTYYSLVSGMKLLKYDWFKKVANERITKAIDFTAKNRISIYKNYKIKYPKIRYEPDEKKVTDKEYKDFFAVSGEENVVET